jgi:uncharacterized membrane protein
VSAGTDGLPGRLSRVWRVGRHAGPDGGERADRRRSGRDLAHAHTHGGPSESHADRRGRLLLAALLVPLAAATVVGLVLLWPAHRDYPVPPQYATPGGGLAVFVSGEVVATEQTGCTDDADRTCLISQVRLGDGPDAGTTTRLEYGKGPGVPRLAPGDRVRLVRTTDPVSGSPAYLYDDQIRDLPLGLLAAAFAVVVVLVARWRGLAALGGLCVAYAVLVFFLLPALLAGEPALGVGLTASAAILFVVLYLVHGPSARTSTALAGTLLSLGLTGLLALLVTDAVRITGMSSDVLPTVQGSAPEVSVGGLVLCGVVIGALGVLNDVTVTQASAVWELAAVDPAASRHELFSAAMRIGRDHIASSVYTLILAYAGSAIPLLLLVGLSGRSVHQIVTGDEFAEEVLRSLIGGLGLVASVPITTALAAVVVAGRRRRPPAGRPDRPAVSARSAIDQLWTAG